MSLFKRIAKRFVQDELRQQEESIQRLQTDLACALLYKDRSDSIRIMPWQGQDYIPRTDQPGDNMLAERQDAVIAIAVRVICNAIMQLPMRVMRVEIKDGVYRYELDDKHPFNEIIDNPNADNTWTEIMSHICQSLILTGTSYLNQEIGGDGVLELWPLEPHRMTIEKDPRGRKTGFRYAIGTSQVSYRRDEILHHRLYSVNNLLYGGSYIEPLRPEILHRYYVNVQQKAFFKNGAHIDRVFTPANTLLQDQREQFQDALNTKHVGPENAGKTFVSPIPGEFDSLSQNNKDLGCENLLKNSRELIFALIGLPPSLGGIYEYANYANALVQEASFWRHTIKPLVKIIEDGFNNQTIWPHYDYDHVVQCDLSAVEALQGDAKLAAETDEILIRAGIQTVDEIRIKRGLEPLPEKPEEPIDPEDAPAVVEPEEEDDYGFTRAGNRLVRNVSRLCSILHEQRLSRRIDTDNNGDNGNSNEGQAYDIVTGTNRHSMGTIKPYEVP